ncbi:MAG: hypothetical protein M0042_15595 [Nitrospiraceae bacterium]|nr:hypothetical protein [Nitrospiraceae bacterium]
MGRKVTGQALAEMAVPQIGNMLVAGEFIVPQDLDFALEHQKYSKGLIGDILVRMGAVEPDELSRVLKIQKKLALR